MMSHSQLFVSRSRIVLSTPARAVLPFAAWSRAPFPTSSIVFLSLSLSLLAYTPLSRLLLLLLLPLYYSSKSSSPLLHLAQDHLSAFHVSQRAVAQTRRFVTRQFRARRRHALLEARVRELRDHFVEHRFAFLLLEEPLHVRVHLLPIGRHLIC